MTAPGREAEIRTTLAIALRNLEAYRSLLLPGLELEQLRQLQSQVDALAGAIDTRFNELASKA